MKRLGKWTTFRKTTFYCRYIVKDSRIEPFILEVYFLNKAKITKCSQISITDWLRDKRLEAKFWQIGHKPNLKLLVSVVPNIWVQIYTQKTFKIFW